MPSLATVHTSTGAGKPGSRVGARQRCLTGESPCDSPISVELYASIAKTKMTSEATTTPRPMYIHHMGHLDNETPAYLALADAKAEHN